MNYEAFSKEELEYLLEHPNEIESGCPKHCDRCEDEEIKQIKKALEDK